MYDKKETLGEISNTRFHKIFGEKPIKASVINIWKNRFELWLENGMRCVLKKSPRHSHYTLKLGDLETFQVRVVNKKGIITYIIEILGKNNFLMNSEEKTKYGLFVKKKPKKQKRMLIRNIPAGKYKMMVFYYDNERMTMSLNGNEYTINTPRNEDFKEPERGKAIDVEIIHKEAVSKKGTKFIMGQLRFL